MGPKVDWADGLYTEVEATGPSKGMVWAWCPKRFHSCGSTCWGPRSPPFWRPLQQVVPLLSHLSSQQKQGITHSEQEWDGSTCLRGNH